MDRPRFLCSLAALLVLAATAMAHAGGHRSIHDTMAGIMERVRQQTPAESLATMTAEDVQKLLTEEERHVLSTEFLNFKVNVPVTVTVFVQVEQAEVPFWLQDKASRRPSAPRPRGSSLSPLCTWAMPRTGWTPGASWWPRRTRASRRRRST